MAAFERSINDEDFGLDSFKKGWFTGTNLFAAEHVLSIEVEKVLFNGRSKYQDVLVFQSKKFGRVLVLDNDIQLTEKDECSYQEMMAFLPLNCHPDPKKVLIVGGGDGGVAREVAKHPKVESVTVCDIDEKVIEVSKKYLPFMAKGFSHPKVKVTIADGKKHVENCEEEYDVIITDSSDPKGPAVCLYEKPYYEALKKALKPGGIVCSQGESFWFHLDFMKTMKKICESVFPVVEYASSYVCTYPGGQICYLLCAKSPNTSLKTPLPQYTTEFMKSLDLKYYSREIHESSVVMPEFVRKVLDE